MNFKYYIQLVRPINFIITFITAIVAVLIAGTGSVKAGIYILTAFSAAVTAAAGNVINDIYDIDTDKINRPGRPLASGRVSVQAATILYINLVFISLITAFYINIYAVIVVSAVNVILRLYSTNLKRVPLAGNMAVAIITGLVFIYGGIAAGNLKNAFVPAIFAFLINFIREILKDIEDIKGDAASGMRTFPVVAGIKQAKGIIFFLTLILILFTFHPFIFRLYSIQYFVIVMVTVNPLLVFFVKSLYDNQAKENLAKLSSILKYNMIFGLAAIYLGR
jgi:geranylgeranylglycerol-phosphate geranylgeranyltransferase